MGQGVKILHGISVQTVITFLIGVSEMIVFAVMSRFLNKTDFGYYAALSAIIIVFSSLSEAGIGSAIIQKQTISDKYISTAFSLSFGLGLFFTLLLYCFSFPLGLLIADENLVLPLKIVATTLLFNSVNSVARGILSRKLNFKVIGIIQLLAYCISSIVGIIMAIYGYGLYAIIVATILNSFLVTILSYSRYVKIPTFCILRTDVKDISYFGGWLTLSVIVNNISLQLDKLVLSKLVSVSELGAYNRPSGFVSGIVGRINNIFDTVLFPILSKLQEHLSELQKVFVKSLFFLNLFSSLLAAFFFFNAELIILVFFGHEWLDLVPVLRIYSITVVFMIDGRLVDCFFRSLGLVKLAFYLRIFACICTFCALFIGVTWSLKGIAWAVVIVNFAIISIKMAFLIKHLAVSMCVVVNEIISSWKPQLVNLLIGCPYLCYSGERSLLLHVTYCLLFLFTNVIMFLFLPRFIGKQYERVVYPLIKSKLLSYNSIFTKR